MKKGTGRVIRALAQHAIIFAALATLAFAIGCPLKRLTGINCPLCGATRAQIMLLKGEIDIALDYHPMALLNVPLLIIAAHARIIGRYTGYLPIAVLFVSAIVIYAVAHAVRDKSALDDSIATVIDWGPKLVRLRL